MMLLWEYHTYTSEGKEKETKISQFLRISIKVCRKPQQAAMKEFHMCQSWDGCSEGPSPRGESIWVWYFATQC